MIRCQSDLPHPWLGTGLLVSLVMPSSRTPDEAAHECVWLNFLESTLWTGTPQLASWHPKKFRASSCQWASGVFVPNALYMPHLATHCALWRVRLARWVKTNVLPELRDETYAEIFRRRFGRESKGSE